MNTMRDHAHADSELSRSGVQRRAEIERELVAAVRNRRTGRAVLAGTGCVVLIACAAFAIRGFTSTPVRTGPIAHHEPNPPNARPTNGPVETDPLPPIHITIVTNTPIPSTPCPEPGSTSPNGLSVCLLSDAQLLSTLSQTAGGASYGIVRVGGTIRVVPNTEQH